MLNANSRIILKKLISTKFKYTNIDSFAKTAPRFSKDEIEETLVYLEEEGYIECVYADNTVYKLSPTYKGGHYQQFVIAQIKEFLLKSVVVPIGVSIITSIIVNIICGII